MRIGILTGGGDVPGLNPCIKAVVNRRRARRARGDRAPARAGRRCSSTTPTHRRPRRTGSSRSTRARCGRSTATAARSCTPRARTPRRVRPEDVPPFLADRADGRGAVRLHRSRAARDRGPRLDVLIPIGGDDTLSYALRLHDEGVPVVAIPKTMDNDVHGTDYCIGFSTAVTRGVQFIHNLRTSTGSHERIAVVELFGRYSGETSLITAYLAGVDRAVISEVPCEIDRLSELLVADKRDNPSNYAMVTVSEGATIEGGELVLSGEAGRVRPPQARRRRRAAGRAAPGAHRRGDHLPAGRVPDALRQPRLARPDGRDELRRDGGRPRARALVGPHGRAAQRLVHDRSRSPPRVRASSASTSTSCTTPSSTGRRCATSPASRCSSTDADHRRSSPPAATAPA